MELHHSRSLSHDAAHGELGEASLGLMSVQPKGTRRTVADLGDTGSSGEKPARNLPRLARGCNPDDACEQAEVVDVGCPGGERFQRVPVSACTAATSQRSVCPDRTVAGPSSSAWTSIGSSSLPRAGG